MVTASSQRESLSHVPGEGTETSWGPKQAELRYVSLQPATTCLDPTSPLRAQQRPRPRLVPNVPSCPSLPFSAQLPQGSCFIK